MPPRGRHPRPSPRARSAPASERPRRDLHVALDDAHAVLDTGRAERRAQAEGVVLEMDLGRSDGARHERVAEDERQPDRGGERDHRRRSRQVAVSRASGWKWMNDSTSHWPLPSISSHTSQKRPGMQNTRRRWFRRRSSASRAKPSCVPEKYRSPSRTTHCTSETAGTRPLARCSAPPTLTTLWARVLRKYWGQGAGSSPPTPAPTTRRMPPTESS